MLRRPVEPTAQSGHGRGRNHLQSSLAQPETDPIADLLKPRTFNDLMAELETHNDD